MCARCLKVSGTDGLLFFIIMGFSQSWDSCHETLCCLFELSHHVSHGFLTSAGAHQRGLLPSPWLHCPLSDRLDGVADSGMYRCTPIRESAELCDRHQTADSRGVICPPWTASPARDEAPLLSTYLHIQVSSITEGGSWWVLFSLLHQLFIRETHYLSLYFQLSFFFLFFFFSLRFD